MCVSCRHTIHSGARHFGWNRSNPAHLTIAPGDSVEFACADASDGQFTASSRVSDVAALDFSRVNPLSGPIHVDTAEPGDALAITIESFVPSGFGWTANIPGFGLLADQFVEPALALWTYDASLREPALFGSHARIPLKPFAGTMGNAPAEAGDHSVVPPRAVGGNLDIRDLSAGTVLYLPVAVPGALFSMGDTHAAQGDGEVCGTAIESAMTAAIRIDLVKGANLRAPRFVTPGPVTRHLDQDGYEVTTGIGPDLMEASRNAVADMIEVLSARFGMAPVEAYMLCSVCGDLRISEIVDQPNWVVSFYVPRKVFA
jgi:acetamidase/formamidase